MRRNSISQTKRQIIFARDDWRCCYCGKEALLSIDRILRPLRRRIVPRDENGRIYEIDHVIAVADGGDNSFNNLITSCWSCNNKKGTKRKKPSYRMFIVNI